MSNYKKGRSSEYYIKYKLEDFGHEVYRPGASKPIDLISFFRSIVFLHEVKRGNWGLYDEAKLYNNYFDIQQQRINSLPVFWFKGDWHWKWTILQKEDKIFQDFLP